MGDNNTVFKGALGLLVILGGLLFYRMGHRSTTFAADGVDPDWDAAAQRCRDSHQPAVVLFTADWCPYCRSLEHDVLPQNDVQDELMRYYGFYKVDLSHPSQQVQAHAGRFGISGIPLLIRYDADGKETARAHFMDARAMMEWLKAGE